MSDENITLSATTCSSLTLKLRYLGIKTRVQFKGSFLKQDKITYDYGKKVNIYIVYEVSKIFDISSYRTLENCLFGAVTWTKNVDIDKYKYFGHGTGLERKGFFSHRSGVTGRNVIIFGIDMSWSTKTDNRKKYILFLVKVLHKG